MQQSQGPQPVTPGRHEHTSFPFLSLAAEIRNRIHEVLFEHTKPLHIADTDGYGVQVHVYLNDDSTQLELSSRCSYPIYVA
jgi:hypothetical protein